MDPIQLKCILEGALMAVNEPLSIERMLTLFGEHEQPSRGSVREALDALSVECAERGVELVEVASGYRYQVRREYGEWVSRLWDERPARYSRALLETLALIAYRQPITRAEIEDIRGVAVSSNIVKTLLERGWVRVIGHRDVPGRPALLATTRAFLDYFNLATLDELPPLAELRDIDTISAELDLRESGNTDQDRETAASSEAVNDASDEESGSVEHFDTPEVADRLPTDGDEPSSGNDQPTPDEEESR